MARPKIALIGGTSAELAHLAAMKELGDVVYSTSPKAPQGKARHQSGLRFDGSFRAQFTDIAGAGMFIDAACRAARHDRDDPSGDQPEVMKSVMEGIKAHAPDAS